MQKAHGEIHHFPVDGNYIDDEGEALVGFYFRLIKTNGQPLSALMGPYNTPQEAENACNNAWQRKDY